MLCDNQRTIHGPHHHPQHRKMRTHHLHHHHEEDEEKEKEKKEKLQLVDLSGMSLESLPNPSLNLALICKLNISNNHLQVYISLVLFMCVCRHYFGT